MAVSAISVRVQGGSRKVKLRTGDPVRIKSFSGGGTVPPGVPSGHVARVPPPTILALSKNGRRVEATVRYHVDARDGSGVLSTHVVKTTAAHLETADVVFQIGDRVRVARKEESVLVGVETPGVILGGDGERYHVSFRMAELPESHRVLDAPINVSQDGVPAHALEFMDHAPSDHGDEDSAEEDEYGNEDDNEDEDDDDDDGRSQSSRSEGSSTDLHTNLSGGATATSHIHPFRLSLPTHLRPLLFQELDLSQVRRFATWMQEKGEEVKIGDARELQQCVNDFYLDACTELAVPHRVALEGLGATAVDIERVALLSSPDDTVDDVVAEFLAMRARLPSG
jgi:hypothetical protein